MPGGVLCADWKIVTRTGMETVTDYFNGALQRRGFGSGDTTVLDVDHRSQIDLAMPKLTIPLARKICD